MAFATIEKTPTYDASGKIAKVLERHFLPDRDPAPLTNMTTEQSVEAFAGQVAYWACVALLDLKSRKYAASTLSLQVATDCPHVLEPLVAARARDILAASPLVTLFQNSSGWHTLSLALVRRAR